MRHHHHHHPPDHPHHGHVHHPHPPHAHALPGLNSVFIEALNEHRFDSTEDLISLVDRRQPKLRASLQKILELGISDPYLAVQLMQLDEAVDTLRGLRELILLSGSRKAAAILPLPPHIWHRLERALHRDLIFNSEDHLPPYLALDHYEEIESIMPRDLSARGNELEAIALEGFFEDGSLLVRRNTARFLQMIGNADRKPQLFVHSLPHRPHHAQFCEANVDVECVLI